MMICIERPRHGPARVCQPVSESKGVTGRELATSRSRQPGANALACGLTPTSPGNLPLRRAESQVFVRPIVRKVRGATSDPQRQLRKKNRGGLLGNPPRVEGVTGSQRSD
jgi:hypothetical protein